MIMNSCSVACVVAAVSGLVVTTLTAGTLPEMGVPHSVGVQLKNHNYERADLERVRELGARVIRKGLYWGAVEKEKGVYDFERYDRLMNDAEELGLTVVGCLYGNNKLYEDHGAVAIRTKEGREGFAGFAAAMAERYKGRNVLWEIWNEPNVRTFWRKDGTHNSDEFAGEYTDLVMAAVPAMLKADPDCFVMAGSVSNYWEPSYQWTEHCLRRGILSSGIRGWSVHPYGVRTPEEFAIGHSRTRELLTKYGAPADFAMLNTERGFAAQAGGLDHTGGQGEGWSGGAQHGALDYQAWHFVRQFMVDQMNDVKLTVWYEWAGAEGFNLFTGDPKHPAHHAATVMIEQLDGYRFVRRLEADSELDYVLLWQNQEGARKLVAWTAPPPGGTPDEAQPHLVTVELSNQPGFDIVAVTGDRRQQAHTVLLSLSGAPQYVAIPGGVEVARVATAPVPRSTTADAPSGSEPIIGATDIGLFEAGVAWKFVPNTGAGSFTLSTDDVKPIGMLHYDFTKSTTQSHPYVMAIAPATIQQGATELVIHARSDIRQRVTFRMIDVTGQTHQFKGAIRGTGGWEPVRIPLTRRLEHWGGAADGKIHFPIQQIALSVPMPQDQKEGKLEFADAMLVGQ
jgi:polysaccharide biosynthesis protein PslG